MEPTFGARLTSWLKFVGMRQADLARALNISRRAVHAWMHDTAAPTTDRIVPIVEALQIPGGVGEFFARMPTLEADVADEEEPLGPHPRTGDITRELDAAAIDRALGLTPSEACPTCGRTGEAA